MDTAPFDEGKRWRRLESEGGEEAEEMAAITCFSAEQVEMLYSNAQEGYGTSLVFKYPDDQENRSIIS